VGLDHRPAVESTNMQRAVTPASKHKVGGLHNTPFGVYVLWGSTYSIHYVQYCNDLKVYTKQSVGKNNNYKMHCICRVKKSARYYSGVKAVEWN